MFPKCAFWLAALLLLTILPASASDVSTWSATDNSNSATPPGGWPEGMNPAQVNDTGRAMMGGIKRWYDGVVASVTLQGGTSPPSASFASWLNTNTVTGTNPYGYLGLYGGLVAPNNFGSFAFVGASRTSDTPPANTAGAMGLISVVINDNVAVPTLTAWNYYGTGTRLAGTGSLNSEDEKFNLGTLAVTNPYTGNVNGQVGNFALQCGGEPAAAPNNLVGTHCNFALKIGPNGDNYAACCGIIFDQNLGTVQAIGMGLNQRVLWDSDISGVNRAYVTSLVNIPGDENALIFTNSGAFFNQGTAGYVSGNANISGAIANGSPTGALPVVNHLAMQGSSTGVYARFFSQGDDANVGIELFPQVTNANNAFSDVYVHGGFREQNTVVASLPTCSIATRAQSFIVSDANAPAYGSSVTTGGGSTWTKVICDGGNWRAH